MHGTIIINSDYQTQIFEKALAGGTETEHRKAEQKEKKESKQNKNLKKPNKSPENSLGKQDDEKDNIQEQNIDMSTDEEVAGKENDARENETETKAACSGIYPEKRNESVNSLLTFSIAELDDFNVGKNIAVYWPKPEAYFGQNCSKYFLLTLTKTLQKFKSSSLKK